MRFNSKLPDVGTTIFTVMSRRALEESAVNLGQGFPDYPVDPRLSQALIETIAEGRNQYAPMEGVVDLQARRAAFAYPGERRLVIFCAKDKRFAGVPNHGRALRNRRKCNELFKDALDLVDTQRRPIAPLR